jgi:hypothetical protein
MNPDSRRVRVKVVPDNEPNAPGEWREIEVNPDYARANFSNEWEYLSTLVGEGEHVVAYEPV